MPTFHKSLTRATTAGADIIDITHEVSRFINEVEAREGLIVVFTPGSTAAITTIEFESGVVDDLREVIEKIAPSDRKYKHDARWGDGNGYSHVRAALIGPSITIPISDGQPILGTWQQVVLCDFDNRPRERKIHLTIMAEPG